MLNPYYIGFLADMLPIIVGLAVLLLLKNVSFGNAKIRVNSDICFQPIEIGKRRDPFHEWARDELIINGIAVRSDSFVEKKALEKLSLIPYWNIGILVKSKPQKRLRVFAHGDEIINLIQNFSPVSGLVLAHILGGSFELTYYE